MAWKEYIHNEVRKEISEDLPIYYWWNHKSAEGDYVAFQTESLKYEKKRKKSYMRFLEKAVKIVYIGVWQEDHSYLKHPKSLSKKLMNILIQLIDPRLQVWL